MNLYHEALQRFAEVYARAKDCGLREPTAMTLATATRAGSPSLRVVLLKGFDADGFVFYTNHESRKGSQLRENPRAALGFHWPPLDEQVTIEGDVSRVKDAEADAYWATRPRQSQIGAWASLQSRGLDSRQILESRFAQFQAKFGSGPIPRPPHWSGFRVNPDRIEFWKSGEYRLHARTVYQRSGRSWSRTLAYP